MYSKFYERVIMVSVVIVIVLVALKEAGVF
jgi:hypothetical protein